MANLFAMLIIGIVIGICVTMIIVLNTLMDDRYFPTDEELAEMCEWYEAQYGKENNE